MAFKFISLGCCLAFISFMILLQVSHAEDIPSWRMSFGSKLIHPFGPFWSSSSIWLSSQVIDAYLQHLTIRLNNSVAVSAGVGEVINSEYNFDNPIEDYVDYLPRNVKMFSKR